MASQSRASAETAALVASGFALGGVLVGLGVAAGRALASSPRPCDDAVDGSVVPTRSMQRKAASQRRLEQSPTETGDLDDEAVAFSRGFSMMEARLNADARQAKAMTRSPGQVLAELQRGNARFWTGRATRPEQSAFERRALISKQFPSTAILSCSDSRVPIEIVFDQGLGDMFVIRVAGNCLDTTTTASLQYAVHHLKVKVLIVMGHEACGAVKAAQLPSQAIDQEPEALGTFLRTIKKGLEGSAHAKIRDPKAQDREAVSTNVRAQIDSLVEDKGIMGKVRDQELIMVGAFYEISSGIVDFFHEVSGDVAEPQAIQKTPSRGVLTRWQSTGKSSAVGGS